MGTTAPDRERSCRMEQGSVGERPLPTVICGPSGVGKGTLISKLMKEYPDKFGFAVSHTTRKPRYMEQDGVHYHFTQRSDMEAAVRDGKFLESAEVHGNLYGTSIAAVEAVADVGKRCILDIDVQGAEQVKKSTLDALFIFISPPTFQELEARLRGRGTETEEQIQKRLKNAKAEMERSSDTTLFDHLLVNDAIENTYKQFKKILGLKTEALVNGFHRHGTALTTYPSPQRTLEKINMGEILSNGNRMTRIGIDTNVRTGMVQGFNGIFRRLSRW